jgi:pyruvate dehydrogenase E2 component (dihydrolipoamide acetyltransferase)
MARSFKLPDLGEGIHEGEIISVRVAVGDSVKEGDIILEVETDKATVEIPSPYNGTVSQILAKPGDVVHVGDILIVFDGEETAAAKIQEGPPAEKKQPSEPAPGVEENLAGRQDRSQQGPVPASPATRRLARELQVDLRKIPPSGPGGLVTAEDVRAFAAATSTPAKEQPGRQTPERLPYAESPGPRRPLVLEVPPLPDFTQWGPVRREPLRSIRRATAKQMALSWSQIPHVNNQDVIDVTQLETFRQNRKAAIAEKGGQLTMTVFALKAAATALKAHPRANASLDVEAGEIIFKNYYHIGVAVDTDDGLIVPVVRDVDRKSISELAIELHALVQLTRQRKITLEDLRGATFTITNAGAMGGGFFAPIINYPEVAILGMGQARWQPVVREVRKGVREIVPRLMMPVVLCIDHRVLDGADAIRFIELIKQCLQDPEELLMTMT